MTDWIEMRAVELDFIDEAPLRVEVEARTTLSRPSLWQAFVDAASWRDWFPGVEAATYPNQEPPYGVGTVRTSTVNGQRFEETMLAWDELDRWAYRIDRCTAPIGQAQVESTQFIETDAAGTVVRWILASDPSEAFAQAADTLPAILTGQLEQALRNLERLRGNR